ncbi:hypothetical protein Belba_3679 [Belliella baltica DSM 15883]|uniref:Uncharacterized protein n=1 Tax=Belliella baltica (strain DSM 15883 / CIP 108006 / LMG 21964 / BA134) TaxID=866536 RepID=I3ZAA1_BELBD|nr:hypothetical protein [Belliella baltica]AFL86169.1 hypothetical protein Belba_3679 [Belliella baltica DSM 15883]
MANEDKKFDDLFKSKLSNHEIKPSSLAWERLEGKLNKKEKAAYFPLLRIAASIILLLGVGYIAWFIAKEDIKEEQPQLAEVIEKSEKTVLNQEELVIEEKKETLRSNEIQKQQVIPQNVEKTSKQKVDVRKIEEVKKQEFIAEIKPIEKTEVVVALPELEIPELDFNEAVAINQPVADEVKEEIDYKITIIGKGIDASEPDKPGLIDEIENKVEKIGGLLNKVDQGFADLQDAKNNLFASITSRKERSK